MTQLDTHPAKHPTMRHPRDKELVPRIMMRMVLVLMILVLAIVTYARLTDRPLIATPPEGEVVTSRDFLLSGDMSGAAYRPQSRRHAGRRPDPRQGRFHIRRLARDPARAYKASRGTGRSGDADPQG